VYNIPRSCAEPNIIAVQHVFRLPFDVIAGALTKDGELSLHSLFQAELTDETRGYHSDVMQRHNNTPGGKKKGFSSGALLFVAPRTSSWQTNRSVLWGNMVR